MIDYLQCLLRCKSKSRESDRHTIELQVMTIDNGKTPLIELCIADSSILNQSCFIVRNEFLDLIKQRPAHSLLAWWLYTEKSLKIHIKRINV